MSGAFAPVRVTEGPALLFFKLVARAFFSGGAARAATSARVSGNVVERRRAGADETAHPAAGAASREAVRGPPDAAIASGWTARARLGSVPGSMSTLIFPLDRDAAPMAPDQRPGEVGENGDRGCSSWKTSAHV
jgi:hypothetical protein